MGDTPFDPLPLSFEEDIKERLRNPRLRMQPEVGPFSTSGFQPFRKPYRDELKNVAPRLGDALMGTQGLEGLAAEVGNPDSSLLERVLSSFGLIAGIAQGKNGKYRTKGAPGRLGAKEHYVKPEPLPRDLDNGWYLKGIEALRNTDMGNSRPIGEAAWRKFFEKEGVKQVELDAHNLGDFFRANPHGATREELLRHYQDNRVRVQDKVYQQSPSDERRHNLVIDGREMTPEQAVRQFVADPVEAKTTLKMLENSGNKSIYAKDDIVQFVTQDIRRKMGLEGDAMSRVVALKDTIDPIKWKHANGRDLLLDPNNEHAREIVMGTGIPRKPVQVGEMSPIGSDGSGEALWNGAVKVTGVTQAPFQVGDQWGTITHWPVTYGAWKRGPQGWHHEPKPPKFVVDSPNMQNAQFDSLDAARAAIDKSHNEEGRYVGSMAGERSDVYREPHFNQVPNYVGHLRTGIYKNAKGDPTLAIDEAQSTRSRQIENSKTGPRDEAKIAELRNRLNEAEKASEEARSEAIRWLKAQKEFDDPPEGTPLEKVWRKNQESGGRGFQALEDWSSPNLQGLLYDLHINGGMPGGKDSVSEQAFMMGNKLNKLHEATKLPMAELQAAQRAPSGHPLVNNPSVAYNMLMRKAIMEGVKSNVDGVTLTPGPMQNERYNLSQHVPGMQVETDHGGQRYVYLDQQGGGSLGRLDVGPDGIVQKSSRSDLGHGVIGQHIGDVLGQGWGRHVMSLPPDPNKRHNIKTADLEIGGQGMREYYGDPAKGQLGRYDNTLLKELSALDPQHPGQEKTHLHYPGQGKEPGPFQYYPLTPKVKKEVTEGGLPLFLAPLAAAGIAVGQGQGLGQPQQPEEPQDFWYDEDGLPNFRVRKKREDEGPASPFESSPW